MNKMNAGFLFLTLFLSSNLLAGELISTRPARSGMLAPAQPVYSPETRLVPVPDMYFDGKRVYGTTTGTREGLYEAYYVRSFLEDSVLNQCKRIVSDIAQEVKFGNVIETVSKEPPFPIQAGLIEDDPEINPESIFWIRIFPNDDWKMCSPKKFYGKKYGYWFAITNREIFSQMRVASFFEECARVCNCDVSQIDEDSYLRICAMGTYLRIYDDQYYDLKINPRTGTFLALNNKGFCGKRPIEDELNDFQYDEILRKGQGEINFNCFFASREFSDRNLKRERPIKRIQNFLKYFKAIYAGFDVDEAKRKYPLIQERYSQSNLPKDCYFKELNKRAGLIIKDLDSEIAQRDGYNVNLSKRIFDRSRFGRGKPYK